MATDYKRETSISFTFEEWLEIRSALLAKNEEFYSSELSEDSRKYWQEKLLSLYDKIDNATCQCSCCENRK